MHLPTTFDEFRDPSLFDVVAEKEPLAVEEEQDIDPVELLGDLADIVDDIFVTWVSDGEEKWAAEAFRCLHQQGLTSDDDDLSHATNAILLCTVGALSRVFYSYAFDEGHVDDWSHVVPDIVGDYPRVSPVALGRLSERLGVSVDSDGLDESPHDLIRELIRVHAPKVSAALSAELSDTWLFPYMWAIPTSDVSYPLPEEHPAWGQLHHPSGNAMNAYAWLADGMPLW